MEANAEKSVNLTIVVFHKILDPNEDSNDLLKVSAESIIGEDRVSGNNWNIYGNPEEMNVGVVFHEVITDYNINEGFSFNE